MSKSKKFYKVLSGLFILAIGILVAVFGGQEVFNVYLGVAAFVFGVCLLVFSCYKFINDKKFDLSPLTIGTVLLWIGITVLFTKWLNFSMIINFIVVASIGIGTALAIFSFNALSKKKPFLGIGQLVVGAVIIVLGILFFTVSGFATAFWIVIGITIAVYGAYYAISVLFDK